MRSKLKPSKKTTRKASPKEFEDKVETEGKISHLDKTMSSLNKNMHISNLSNTRNAVDPGQSSKLRGDSNISMLPNINIPGRDSSREYALSPSQMHVNRQKQSALAKQTSRGALSIMNVTFNDETIKNSRFSKGKAGDVKEKQPFGATAFHIASKKRIKRI